MTLRCRKGDMAMLTKTAQYYCVGAIVNVLEFYGDYFDDWDGDHPNCWRIEYRSQTYIQPDDWMIPIRPGDLDETEETEKKLEFFGR